MEKLQQLSYMVKWREKRVKITGEIRDIIHGYIISDGYLSDTGILTIDQSIAQEKFVEWLFQYLSPLCTQSTINNGISTLTRFDKRTNKATKSKRFSTRAVCRGFHRMWYKSTTTTDNQGAISIRYIKKLPNDMSGFFTPTFLAIWFAGDGTKILGSVGAKYEVTAFSPGDRLKLKDLFWTIYQIDAKINRGGTSASGRDQWTLNINSDDYPKFRSLITKIPLIETLFPHKLCSSRPKS